MKNIFLMDRQIKSERGSNLYISTIKNNGLTIVDIIRSHFSIEYNISLIKDSDNDNFSENIDSFDENIIWPLNIFPNNLEEIQSIFDRVSLSIYDVKIYGNTKKQQNTKKTFNNLDLQNHNIDFIFCKKNNDLSFNKNKVIEIISKSLIVFSSKRTYLSLRTKRPVSRNFNQLLLKDNWYEKSSNDISKLKREYYYLKNLPYNLKNFFPKISPSGLKVINNSRASYKVSYIPGENMAGLLLGDKLKKKDATQFYEFISNWLNSVENEIIPKFNITEFLIKKCLMRYEQLIKFGLYDQLAPACSFLSIKTPKNLLRLITNNLRTYSNEINNFPSGYYHGDLCLSNIISYHDKFYLIDPRGFDNDNPKLNIIYELAKLRHSIIDYYDILNSEDAEIIIPLSSKFKIKCSENTSYKLLKRVYYDLIEFFAISDSLIKTVEASLFFSMMPLHKESPKKVFSFYLTSIKIIDENED